MGYTDPTKNAMLDSIAARVAFISLHSADPGTTGANEVTNITRVAVAWAAAANGTKTNSADIVLNVTAGDAFSYIGLWDAQTGGTFNCGAALNVAQTAYPTNGSYKIPAGSLVLD